MLRILLFGVGLVLSSVAAFYSVTGLAFIFAGAFWPIIIMGTALEAAKLVGASWVFRTWRTASKVLVSYVMVGVLLLMGITGIGIFGYLTRAYLAQQAPMVTLVAERDAADRAVQLARQQYERDTQTVRELSGGQTTDAVVRQLTSANRLSGRNGAVTLLRTQQSLQADARVRLQASADALQTAEQTLANVAQKMQMQTVDLGPLMFAAKAYYGNTEVATMDRVATLFIGLLLLVFDPMAIALLLAAQSQTVMPETKAPESHEDIITRLQHLVEQEDRDVVTAPPMMPTTSTTSTTPAQGSGYIDSPDMFDLRSGERATYEPAAEITVDEMTPEMDIDTDSIAAPVIGMLPIERPSASRRRTRTAPKRP